MGVLTEREKKEVRRVLKRMTQYRSVYKLAQEAPDLWKQIVEIVPQRIWMRPLSQIIAYIQCWLKAESKEDLKAQLKKYENSSVGQFYRRWEKLFPSRALN